MALERMTSEWERAIPDGRDSADEIDWRELVRSVNRKKGPIIGLTLVLTALVIGFLTQLSPRYTAEALVGIEARRFQAIDIKDVVSNLPIDMTSVNSEIEIVRSRALAERVIQRLRLTDDPEFNETLPPPQPNLVERLHPRTLLPEPWATLFPSTPLEPARILTLVVDKFIERLSVQPKGVSYVFSVQFVSEDPAKAARIANTIAEIYISEQEDIKREGTRRANAWLEERVREMVARVQVLERNVDSYRQEAGLIQGRNVYVSEQQLAELNTQLVLAKARRAEAEARHAQVSGVLSGKGKFEATTEVLASPLIQRLREKEGEILRNESQLTETYGPRHPKVVNNQAELRDLRRMIGEEVGKIAAGLASELDVARTREQSLSQAVDALERRAGEIHQAEIRLNELQREADGARALYETFLARLNETTAQAGMQRPDARILTLASPPEKATFPDLPRFGGAAFLASLLLAGVVMISHDRSGRRFRSAEQVERLTGLPTVALMPRLPRRHQSSDYVLASPRSAYAESIHGLLATLRVMDAAPRKTILITSAVDGEGKSLLAVSLARIAAQSGRRVVLIDADLRAPRLHSLLGVARDNGLADIMASQAGAADLYTDEKTGLRFLAAGGDKGHPADLLARPTTKDMLRALAAEYDLVIIDSPPVLSAIDARLLSQLADCTLYVLQWGRTPREVAQAGLRLLSEAGARLGGVVLSKVDLRKYARYGDASAGAPIPRAFTLVGTSGMMPKNAAGRSSPEEPRRLGDSGSL